jgi:bidirectional [NiFe] hydrogenase diaphorase subunit
MPALLIDDRPVSVAPGTTLLEAARAAGVMIPALCAHEGLDAWGGCRLCVVDISRPGWSGPPKMVASCLYAAEDGLVVQTTSPRVLETRRAVLDLLLARCPDAPLVRQLAREHGVPQTSYAPVPEPTDCILCNLCTRACEAMGVSAIGTAYRGTGRAVVAPFEHPPEACIGCLACARVCPTHCIPFTDHGTTRTIWGRTFEMQTCRRCGQPTVTAEQATWAAARHDVPAEDSTLCDTCKRLVFAELAERLGGRRHQAGV